MGLEEASDSVSSPSHTLFSGYTLKPPHDKTNKMTVHPVTTLRCRHEENLGPWLPIERTVKTLITLGRSPG